MAPAAKARWFHLRSVRLGNTFDPTYPNGDSVGAIVPWQPPEDELASAPNHELNTALDAIKAGPEPGVLYTASKRGQSSDRWCGNVLCQMFDTSEKQAAKMIKDWLKSGTLQLTEYRHPKFRKAGPRRHRQRYPEAVMTRANSPSHPPVLARNWRAGGRVAPIYGPKGPFKMAQQSPSRGVKLARNWRNWRNPQPIGPIVNRILERAYRRAGSQGPRP